MFQSLANVGIHVMPLLLSIIAACYLFKKSRENNRVVPTSHVEHTDPIGSFGFWIWKGRFTNFACS